MTSHDDLTQIYPFDVHQPRHLSDVFDNTDPQEAIAQIAALDPELQPGATNEWFAVYKPWIAVVTRGVVRTYGRSRDPHMAEEIEQIVRTHCWELINEVIKDPQLITKVRSLNGYIRSRCRNSIRDHVESMGSHGLTKVSSKMRRARELETLTWEMTAKLGRTPSKSEVVSEWDQQASKRKDPARQGRKLEDDDFGFHKSVSAVEGDEKVHLEAYDEPDFVLLPMESERFQQQVVSAAVEHSEQMGLAARMWLDEEQNPTRTRYGVLEAIRLHAGMSNHDEVQSMIERIRELAVGLLERLYGIRATDL